MSRSSRIKATSGALNPRGLDFTKFRQRGSREGRRLNVRSDDAAGALAFVALDRYEDTKGDPVAANDPAGMRRPGDPLAALLVRLKYAEHFSNAIFVDATKELVARYSGFARHDVTERMRDAVAAAALFEWIHDACPRCRRVKPARTVVRCPAGCDRGAVGRGGLRERLRPSRRKRRPKDWIHPDIEQALISGALRDEVWLPVPEGCCATCSGRGFLVSKAQRPKGMHCSLCHNSGVVALKAPKRFDLVALSPLAGGMKRKDFTRWHPIYYKFIDALRALDRRMASTIDFGLYASQGRDLLTHEKNARLMSAIDSGIEEKQDVGALNERAESVVAVGQTAVPEPTEAHGEDTAAES